MTKEIQTTVSASPLSEGLGKQYENRNSIKQGIYYLRHVSAMTAEGLHSKADIAAELAHRDIEIDRLKRIIAEHNNQLFCDKEKCGYAPYKRDCPDCPKQWFIDA